VTHDDTCKFQTKLWSIEALTVISAPGISIYNRPLLIDNSQLPGYNSPSASDVSELRHVECMISYFNTGVLIKIYYITYV